MSKFKIQNGHSILPYLFEIDTPSVDHFVRASGIRLIFELCHLTLELARIGLRWNKVFRRTNNM
mgnify:CR=1 FL=1